MGNVPVQPNGSRNLAGNVSQTPYSSEGVIVENGWTDLGASNVARESASNTSQSALREPMDIQMAVKQSESLQTSGDFNRFHHPCADIRMRLSPYLSVGTEMNIALPSLPPLPMDLFDYSFNTERDVISSH